MRFAKDIWSLRRGGKVSQSTGEEGDAGVKIKSAAAYKGKGSEIAKRQGAGERENEGTKLRDYGGISLTRKESERFILMFLAADLFLCLLYFRSVLPALLALSLIPKAKKIYEKRLAEARKKRLRLQFRDVLYSLSASFAAGRQMSAALSEAAENMALLYPKGSDMEEELRYIVRGIYESREKEEALLADFARRSRLEDIESFVEVYTTCRHAGADVEKVVAKAAGNLMDKMEIEKTIETLASQKKLEGRTIALMPPLVLAVLNLSSYSYVAALYETAAGKLIMLLALAINIFSFYVMERLGNVEV